MSERRDGFHSISTAAELSQRKAERVTPAVEPNLTPGNGDSVSVHERLARLREGRIGELQSRLSTMRERAETDHVFAALEGRSKVDFDRSR